MEIRRCGAPYAVATALQIALCASVREGALAFRAVVLAQNTNMIFLRGDLFSSPVTPALAGLYSAPLPIFAAAVTEKQLAQRATRTVVSTAPIAKENKRIVKQNYKSRFYCMGGKMFICDDIMGTFFKKHKCADCKVKLKRKIFSKIIDAKEARNYRRHIRRNPITGDVKISWYEFECPICKKSFTLEQLEKTNEKNI